MLLVGVFGLVGCVAEPSGGLLGADAAASDVESVDAAPIDAGVSRADAAQVDVCPPETDRILARGAHLDESPQIVGHEARVTVIWRDDQGIGGINLGPEGEESFRVGHAQVEQVQLLEVGGEPHLLWVEYSQGSTFVRDLVLGGSTGLIDLGPVGPVRLAASAGGPVALTLVTVGSDWVANIRTVSAQGRVSLVRSEALERPDSPSPTALAVVRMASKTYLAWAIDNKIRLWGAPDGVSNPFPMTLEDPAGGDLLPGFRFLLHSPPGGLAELLLLAPGAAGPAAHLHLFGIHLSETTHRLVQGLASGRADFTASATWVDALGQFVVAWPDFRESFDGRRYELPRRIYGASVFASGWLSGESDVPLSPASVPTDAIRPSLASLGGDTLAIAYLTSTGEVHLATANFRCLAPVPDLP